jgi:hypothetical protein
MSVPVSSGCERLIVEVAANERHEGAAGRMNSANRQPSGNLCDLWVIARQNLELQLGRGFHGGWRAPFRIVPLRSIALSHGIHATFQR